jgi:hypothetical protein
MTQEGIIGIGEVSNLDKAIVPLEEIKGYLLSEEHSAGKTEFFVSLGFSLYYSRNFGVCTIGCGCLRDRILHTG